MTRVLVSLQTDDTVCLLFDTHLPGVRRHISFTPRPFSYQEGTPATAVRLLEAISSNTQLATFIRDGVIHPAGGSLHQPGFRVKTVLLLNLKKKGKGKGGEIVRLIKPLIKRACGLNSLTQVHVPKKSWKSRHE